MNQLRATRMFLCRGTVPVPGGLAPHQVFDTLAGPLPVISGPFKVVAELDGAKGRLALLLVIADPASRESYSGEPMAKQDIDVGQGDEPKIVMFNLPAQQFVGFGEVLFQLWVGESCIGECILGIEPRYDDV